MTGLVSVEALRVELSASIDVVDEVGFEIKAGEILGLVGESGSGKTTVATALLGATRRGARIAAGRVVVDGVDLLALDAKQLRATRGQLVAYVPQDPAAALNPALRVGKQLEELLEAHDPDVSRRDRHSRMLQALADVRLPAEDALLRRYPHQLSGGQQQRVCIAMAFLLRPRVIVFDEPTTSLDVTTQSHVLEMARGLCESRGVAALYVTHDLAVVANLATRILVMYAGRIVEVADNETLFTEPAHPYTAKLLAAIPHLHERQELGVLGGSAAAPGNRPQGCAFWPRCSFAKHECRGVAPELIELTPKHSVRCLRAEESVALRVTPRRSPPRQQVARQTPVLRAEEVDVDYGANRVLHGVSMNVLPGECVALVGESGSGKTTLSRALIGLVAPSAGTVYFRDEPQPGHARDRSDEVRHALQYIFQSPYNSLNPRRSIGEIVETPIRHFFKVGGSDAGARAEAALERVSLSPDIVHRFPDELSGGERQRVAIARALVCEPAALICDEITSALDVSVQAAILELLSELQQDSGLSMLFVTHNLAVGRLVADRIIVMHEGTIVEEGPAEQVLDRPTAEYTRDLVANTPTIDAAGDE